ncbi:MAG: hypothetical protein ACOXZV_02660 [Bacteroidales bacterium]
MTSESAVNRTLRDYRNTAVVTDDEVTAVVRDNKLTIAVKVTRGVGRHRGDNRRDSVTKGETDTAGENIAVTVVNSEDDILGGAVTSESAVNRTLRDNRNTAVVTDGEVTAVVRDNKLTIAVKVTRGVGRHRGDNRRDSVTKGETDTAGENVAVTVVNSEDDILGGAMTTESAVNRTLRDYRNTAVVTDDEVTAVVRDNKLTVAVKVTRGVGRHRGDNRRDSVTKGETDTAGENIAVTIVNSEDDILGGAMTSESAVNRTLRDYRNTAVVTDDEATAVVRDNKLTVAVKVTRGVGRHRGDNRRNSVTKGETDTAGENIAVTIVNSEDDILGGAMTTESAVNRTLRDYRNTAVVTDDEVAAVVRDNKLTVAVKVTRGVGRHRGDNRRDSVTKGETDTAGENIAVTVVNSEDDILGGAMTTESAVNRTLRDYRNTAVVTDDEVTAVVRDNKLTVAVKVTRGVGRHRGDNRRDSVTKGETDTAGENIAVTIVNSEDDILGGAMTSESAVNRTLRDYRNTAVVTDDEATAVVRDNKLTVAVKVTRGVGRHRGDNRRNSVTKGETDTAGENVAVTVVNSEDDILGGAMTSESAVNRTLRDYRNTAVVTDDEVTAVVRDNKLTIAVKVTRGVGRHRGDNRRDSVTKGETDTAGENIAVTVVYGEDDILGGAMTSESAANRTLRDYRNSAVVTDDEVAAVVRDNKLTIAVKVTRGVGRHRGDNRRDSVTKGETDTAGENIAVTVVYGEDNILDGAMTSESAVNRTLRDYRNSAVVTDDEATAVVRDNKLTVAVKVTRGVGRHRGDDRRDSVTKGETDTAGENIAVTVVNSEDDILDGAMTSESAVNRTLRDYRNTAVVTDGEVTAVVRDNKLTVAVKVTRGVGRHRGDDRRDSVTKGETDTAGENIAVTVVYSEDDILGGAMTSESAVNRTLRDNRNTAVVTDGEVTAVVRDNKLTVAVKVTRGVSRHRGDDRRDSVTKGETDTAGENVAMTVVNSEDDILGGAVTSESAANRTLRDYRNTAVVTDGEVTAVVRDNKLTVAVKVTRGVGRHRGDDRRDSVTKGETDTAGENIAVIVVYGEDDILGGAVTSESAANRTLRDYRNTAVVTDDEATAVVRDNKLTVAVKVTRGVGRHRGDNRRDSVTKGETDTAGENIAVTIVNSEDDILGGAMTSESAVNRTLRDYRNTAVVTDDEVAAVVRDNKLTVAVKVTRGVGRHRGDNRRNSVTKGETDTAGENIAVTVVNSEDDILGGAMTTESAVNRTLRDYRNTAVVTDGEVTAVVRDNKLTVAVKVTRGVGRHRGDNRRDSVTKGETDTAGENIAVTVVYGEDDILGGAMTSESAVNRTLRDYRNTAVVTDDEVTAVVRDNKLTVAVKVTRGVGRHRGDNRRDSVTKGETDTAGENIAVTVVYGEDDILGGAVTTESAANRTLRDNRNTAVVTDGEVTAVVRDNKLTVAVKVTRGVGRHRGDNRRLMISYSCTFVTHAKRPSAGNARPGFCIRQQTQRW